MSQQSATGGSGGTNTELSNWIAQFYQQNNEQLFGQLLGAYSQDEVIQYQPELVGWTMDQVQGQLTSNDIQQFLAQFQGNYNWTSVQNYTQQNSQYSQFWNLLTNLAPQYFEQQILSASERSPAAAGQEQPLAGGGQRS